VRFLMCSRDGGTPDLWHALCILCSVFRPMSEFTRKVTESSRPASTPAECARGGGGGGGFYQGLRTRVFNVDDRANIVPDRL